MKKNLIKINLLCTLMGTMVYAQQGRVGINTDSPKATLDIHSINGESVSGILIPRLNGGQFESFLKNTPLGVDQHSMMLYLTEPVVIKSNNGYPRELQTSLNNVSYTTTVNQGQTIGPGYVKYIYDSQSGQGTWVDIETAIQKTTTLQTRYTVGDNGTTRYAFGTPSSSYKLTSTKTLVEGRNSINLASIDGDNKTSSVNADYAAAVGVNTIVEGKASFASGQDTKIGRGAESSFAMGQNTEVLESASNSFVGGNASKAKGAVSFAFGTGAYAEAGEVALGFFNTDAYSDASVGKKRLFVIGRGESAQKRDAFSILGDGKTGIGYDSFDNPNISGNSALLQVNGAILSGYLKGTGDRPVYADANGVLKIGPSSAVYTVGQGMKLNGNTFSRTGLEQADGKNGLTIIGRTEANYGTVGTNAVDLSFSNSTDKGAKGNYSVAMGFNNVASGEGAVVMGGVSNSALSAIVPNQASGASSVAMGLGTTASARASVAMGRSTNTGNSDNHVVMGMYNTVPNRTDARSRLLTVGAGTAVKSADAFTVLKNKKVGVAIDALENDNDINDSSPDFHLNKKGLRFQGVTNKTDREITCNRANQGSINYVTAGGPSYLRICLFTGTGAAEADTSYKWYKINVTQEADNN
ncbi:hypothetical protein [Riemerella columbipharyngis]|uniref:Head domain of trimeric autotransporter adhesin n=1 Tax=Riemerella columbipharyngis TaxID=1071918 RepID=A0A1G7FVM8_9FLAO|nr:hypothetical protein [Riemerella columbipharyngis]SDE79924.1 Head domain of trimeric autotransporter adhesin [Riemerella columbipharyngis]